MSTIKSPIIQLISTLESLNRYLWYSSPETPTGSLARREARLARRIKQSLQDIVDGNIKEK